MQHRETIKKALTLRAFISTNYFQQIHNIRLNFNPLNLNTKPTQFLLDASCSCSSHFTTSIFSVTTPLSEVSRTEYIPGKRSRIGISSLKISERISCLYTSLPSTSKIASVALLSEERRKSKLLYFPMQGLDEWRTISKAFQANALRLL